jgi:hypothetical protein
LRHSAVVFYSAKDPSANAGVEIVAAVDNAAQSVDAVDARLLLKRAGCKIGFSESEEMATSAINSMWSEGCDWCGSRVGAASTSAPEGGRSTAKLRNFVFDLNGACKKM